MRFLDEMYQAAKESAPGEMCGLVIRQNDTEKWILCQNISEDKNDFEIDFVIDLSNPALGKIDSEIDSLCTGL